MPYPYAVRLPLARLAGVEVGLGGRGGAHGGGEDEGGVCQAVPSLVAALVGEAGLRRLRRAQDGTGRGLGVEVGVGVGVGLGVGLGLGLVGF